MSKLSRNDIAILLDGLETDTLTQQLTRLSGYEFLNRYQRDHSISNISSISIELTRFGKVADSIGGLLSDKLMVAVIRRLHKTIPELLAITRTHGDHFILFFEYEIDISSRVKQLLDYLQRPFALAGQVIVLSIRLGVVDKISQIKSADDMIRAAEIALHRAADKRHKVIIYTHDMVDKAKLNHNLENDLRVSLVNNAPHLHTLSGNEEFSLLYQPIVSSVDKCLHSYEALIRWNHPVRGVIAPDDFISLAESISEMDFLSSWVIRKACHDALYWKADAQGRRPKVSINISPTQFIESHKLFKAIKFAFEESQIEPNRVIFEIIESTAFPPHMKEHIEAIKALGCSVSLDDFGTGFSSLAQLHVLPIDFVKIDKSFLTNIGSADTEAAKLDALFIQSILRFLNVLNLTTIVEGIETQEQLQVIQKFNADLIQGFYIAEPMTFADTLKYNYVQ